MDGLSARVQIRGGGDGSGGMGEWACAAINCQLIREPLLMFAQQWTSNNVFTFAALYTFNNTFVTNCLFNLEQFQTTINMVHKISLKSSISFD